MKNNETDGGPSTIVCYLVIESRGSYAINLSAWAISNSSQSLSGENGAVAAFLAEVAFRWQASSPDHEEPSE